MNVYVYIAANYEAEINFYIVCVTSDIYTLQEDVKLYGNKLESGNFFCNEIYTYTRQPKPRFYVEACKRQNNYDCVNE